jgi:hypothetical protein
MLDIIEKKQKWVYIVLSMPIDFNWIIATPLDFSLDYGFLSTQAEMHIQGEYGQQTIEEQLEQQLTTAEEMKFLIKKFSEVLQNAPSSHLGSKLRRKPYLITFPGENTWVILGFCYKLENNGDTVIVIPKTFAKNIINLLNQLVGEPCLVETSTKLF